MSVVVRGLGAVVLAGGMSSRMGSPKAWLDFDGEPLLARVVGRIAEAALPIVVVAAPGQDLPALPVHTTVVRDAVEGRGPLQGISAGLAALEGRADAAFVSSTDAPFLLPELVRRLAALREERGVDVVVPRADGHDHSLAAVYAIGVRAVVDDLLAHDRLRPFFIFERVRTLVAEPELLLADPALAAVDPRLASLRNVNTRDEYEAALAELRAGRR